MNYLTFVHLLLSAVSFSAALDKMCKPDLSRIDMFQIKDIYWQVLENPDAQPIRILNDPNRPVIMSTAVEHFKGPILTFEAEKIQKGAIFQCIVITWDKEEFLILDSRRETFNESDALLPSPRSILREEGAEVHLTCGVYLNKIDISDILNVSWSKQKCNALPERIEEDNMRINISTVTTKKEYKKILVIKDFKLSDAFDYKCHVSTKNGPIGFSRSLIIKPKQNTGVIAKMLQSREFESLTLQEGTSKELICGLNLKHFPSPKTLVTDVFWSVTKGPGQIERIPADPWSQTSMLRIFQSSSTDGDSLKLQLSKAEISDTGTYICNVITTEGTMGYDTKIIVTPNHTLRRFDDSRVKVTSSSHDVITRFD